LVRHMVNARVMWSVGVLSPIDFSRKNELAIELKSLSTSIVP